MRWETYNFTPDFQDAIFACLIRHPEEFFAFGEIVKPAYFTGPAASELMFRYIEYRKKYGEYPNFSTLGNFAFHKASVVNVDHAKETLDYVEKLSKIDTSKRKAIIDLSLKFAKERAIYDAIRKIHAAQTEGKMEGVDPVKIMQDAVAVGTNYSDLGVSFYHDAEAIVRKSMTRDAGVMPGYSQFEKLWQTGWGAGWLVVLLAPPKRYKCLGKGTPILMFDGSVKPVEEIKVGDKIMGDDSTPRTVIQCGRGHGTLYRVEQSSGESFVCNDAHILCVQHPDGRIKEITAEDFHAQVPWFKRQWQGYKACVEYPKRPVPLDPYLLGLWLADGTTSKPEICVASEDKEIAHYLLSYAHKHNLRINYGEGQGCRQFRFAKAPRRDAVCTVTGCKEPHSAGGMCHKHYCRARYRSFRASDNAKHWSNPIKDALVKLGVYSNKRIPNSYLINSRTVRLKVLAGIIDGDGNFTKNRGFIINLTNQQLAEDTCKLARSLGFLTSIQPYKTSIKSIGYVGRAWRVTILGQLSEVPVLLPRKRATDSVKHQNRRYKIKTTPIGEGEYWGFTLDGNNRFLLGDATVTHNTAFAINLALNIVKSQDADVLYYACEISQELAAMRAYSNITGWTKENFIEYPEKGIIAAQKAVKRDLWGNIWFKGYPSKSVTISEIKSHAHQVIDLYDLHPKAIVIDYAETVRPDKVDKDVPDWRQQADIYTQARALGAEFGCCVIMPDRCNKETVGKKVPSMKSFQGSFEKAGIVDAAIGLCATEDEHKHDRVRYFVFLNRHGTSLKHYDGTVDPERMRMTVGQEIEYTPDDEDEKPQRRSYTKRRMASGAALTQSD